VLRHFGYAFSPHIALFLRPIGFCDPIFKGKRHSHGCGAGVRAIPF